MAARRYEISVRVLRNISRVSHSNGDLFTCKDNMVFSHMKICFCGKAHLVFHFCLYNKYMLFTGLGRSVLGETVPEVLSTASGGTQTEGTVSPNTDRPRPVNNIFIFFLLRFKSFRKILLQPPTYVCWRRARSCWCYSKRAIDCKPKQNITTWFLTCNLYYHN